jgi:IPT/TIG domain
LYLDGVKQTFVSLTDDTSVIFTLTSFGTQSPLSVKFYSDQGTPNGANAIANPSLKITPTLISLTPSVGSAAGTVIKVTGSGFGSLTTNLNLWSGSSGNVCKSVTYVDPFTLLCTTNPVFMNTGELQLNTGNAQTSAPDNLLT